MKVQHPDKEHHLVMVEGTSIMGEVETGGEYPQWVSLGYVSSDRGLLIDHDEWASFVALVLEIDVLKKEK